MAKKARKPKLGTGGRFAGIKNKAAKYYESKGKSPAEAERIGAAIAAKVGIKKYGKKKMISWAVKRRKGKK